ncbi:hypothetical protein RUM44_005579 [Polyplax serrata]|uniref:Lymphoid-specific helicase n=1 Tax=Polyplax serrata TaxID=468196 RepID=A0ABR1AF31_POLSC
MENNSKSDQDEEGSNCSFTSTSTDKLFIDYRIIKEEERLMVENEKFEDKLEQEVQQEGVDNSKEEFVESKEELARRREEELRIRRFKKLTHLLESSQIYSTLIKETLRNELSKRKNKGSQQTDAKEEIANSRKTQQLSKLFTEKEIEQCQTADKGIHEVVEEDSYFKETRVTRFGFTVSYKQPILLDGGALKDYQLKGLEWLKVLFSNGVNGILADEMGLGKTIQVIAFICYMIEQNIMGPFLIVAPLSTINNWMSEFQRFASGVPVMLYHGNENMRRQLFPNILKVSKILDKQVHNVIITSYEVLIRDRAILKKISWYYLIIDEGQRIKNYKSLLARTLSEFNSIGRLILTGTPLQNDLSELWSLLNFLLPEIFNNLNVFQSWFDINELQSNCDNFIKEKFNVNVVTMLREILMPFLLRRKKQDVNLNLPPKKEILIFCSMSLRQRQLYESTLDRSIEHLVKPKHLLDLEQDILSPRKKRRCFLNSAYGKKTVQVVSPRRESVEKKEQYMTNLNVRNIQMILRKIVHHPYLIQYPLQEGTEELRIDEDLVKESGKMLILDALLSKLKDGGHKVLIFSFFKEILDILEDYSRLRQYLYCRLDGNMDMKCRQEEIQAFNSDPNIFLFLITMRSGGLGINLTSADTVIFYDSDWSFKRSYIRVELSSLPLILIARSLKDAITFQNPQINLQSQDRCHRIGQSKPVIVYRLCVKGTIDENIIERGNAKRRLEKMILQEGKFTLNSKSAKALDLGDLRELKQLLESTDHSTIIHSNGYVLNGDQLEFLVDRKSLFDKKDTDEEKIPHGFYEILDP